tara:strand:- start:28546 stop:28998 length:453 start_codon:yes stop_codon:yes gene_type:complete
MPNLGLANNITSKPEHRQLMPSYEELFGSGTGGFGTTNATLLNASKRMRVEATSADGYASKTLSVTPGVTYTFSIQFYHVGGSTQTGGVLQLGNTDGGVDLIDEGFAGSTSTHTANVIPTSSSIYLRLVTSTSGKSCYWDNVSLEETTVY